MSIFAKYIKLLYLPFFSIIVGAHLFILNKLIFFPYPEFFIYPYLTNKGLIPYKQIFDQHFPGLMFLPINLGNLGMTTPQVAQIWLLALVMITQILIFFISNKLFKDWKKALFSSLLYLIWQPYLDGSTLWIESFLPLFLLPAFYFLHKALVDQKKQLRLELILAGGFLGLAILFKQMAIPLSGMVLLLLVIYRFSAKSIFYFLLGLIPIPVVMLVYFFSLGALSDFVYWTVIYNLTVFPRYGGKLPTFTGLVRIVGIYSPAIFLAIFKNSRTEILLLVFIIGSLSGDIARFDFVHFQASLPFLVILTSLVFSKLLNIKILRWFILAYFVVATIWSVIFYRGHISNKILLFDDQTYQIADRIKRYSSPNEEIFILGSVPHLYQLSNTLPSGRIFILQFPWFFRVTEDKFLFALQNTPPNLIVLDNSVMIEGDPVTHYAAKLEDYIGQNYTIIDKVGTTEFLRRN